MSKFTLQPAKSGLVGLGEATMKSCLRVNSRLPPELLLSLFLPPQLLLPLILMLSVVAKPSLLLQPECLLCQALSMFQTQPCLAVVVVSSRLFQTEPRLTSKGMLLSLMLRSIVVWCKLLLILLLLLLLLLLLELLVLLLHQLLLLLHLDPSSTRRKAKIANWLRVDLESALLHLHHQERMRVI